MIRENYELFHKKADNYYPKFLKLMDELIKYPSIAFQEPEGVNDCAECLNGIFTDYGYKSKLYSTAKEGHPVVYAEKNVGAKKTISFYHHYDVQPVEPLELWKSSPWKFTERDGRLYGRGVADDKGELVISLLAMQILEDLEGQLPLNVKFICEGEEEAGSNNLPLFTNKNTNLLKSDGCVWEGATLTPRDEDNLTFETPVDLVCGLKGDAYFDLKTAGPPKFPRTDVHSGSAAAVPNAAWYLIWALNTLKDQNENILIEGVNELIAGPSKEDIEVLKKATGDTAENIKNDYQINRTLLDRKGLDLDIELALKPSLTISGLKSGYQGEGSKTIVPAEALAKLDFRLVPNLTMEKVDELLRKHLLKHGFDGIEVKLHTGYDPGKTPVNHPFIKMLQRVSNKITSPIETQITPIAAGSGPAYLFTPYSPICFIGNYIGGTNGHAPNENMPIRSIKSSIAFNVIIAQELCKE